MWVRILSILAALSLTVMVFAFAESAHGGAAVGGDETEVGLARTKPALPWSAPDAEQSEPMIAEMKANFGREFRYATVGPWLIATDMDADELSSTADSTIGTYAASIQRQLFTKKVVTQPLKVLLFKDGESYEKWNKKLYNERPTTPYGYFSRAKRALVMNIGTGGGTLIHEMTHAMAEADFPAIPAWLNEGLGSLYEAAAMDSKHHVIGIKNWRLKGLLDDLKKGTAAHYRTLIGISDGDFYGENRGANYASMRYLMQWLQDKGKLEAFYVRIRDAKDEKPQDALRALFDNKYTIEEIEGQVYAWVKTL